MIINKTTQLTFTILTLFPQMFPGPLAYSIAGKALEQKKWLLNTVDIRKFATDIHRTVDGKPFGGGPGMLMRADILGKAIDHAMNETQVNKLIYLSPKGQLLNQQLLKKLIDQRNLLILCGRFEGIDQRLIDEYDCQEISLGDFILSGGELAALSLMDGCIRLLPGVLKNQHTIQLESFSNNQAHLLEYPQYTKPVVWRQREVPRVLLSGNHQEIKQWQHNQSIKLTKEKRLDLWENYFNDYDNKS